MNLTFQLLKLQIKFWQLLLCFKQVFINVNLQFKSEFKENDLASTSLYMALVQFWGF